LFIASSSSQWISKKMRLAPTLALVPLLSLPFVASAFIAPAAAEVRTFVVGNDDGYGVDRCLATGASCGAAVAGAYCRSQNFVEAKSFRLLERDEITGAGDQIACLSGCLEFVAIECVR
jgi:hypothetical protein